MKSVRFAIIAALILVSCMSENDGGQDGSFVSFVAERENPGEDGLYKWKTGEMFGVLDGRTVAQYKTYLAGEKVAFSSVRGIGRDSREVYAVYPYMDGTEHTADGIKVDCGTGLDLAVAYTGGISDETGLMFRNVCGYIAIELDSQEGVTAVSVRGFADEALTGNILLSFDEEGLPFVSSVEKAGYEVRLESDDVMSGRYLIPVLPVIMSEGYEMTFVSEAGMSAVKSVEEEVLIRRNVVHDMGLVSSLEWKTRPQLRVTSVGTTNAGISWTTHSWKDAVADCSGEYTVRLYTDAGMEEMVQTYDWPGSGDSGQTHPSVSFSDLVPLQDYWVTVTDNITGAVSPALTFCTIMPATLTVGNVFWSDAYLYWDGGGAECAVILNGEPLETTYTDGYAHLVGLVPGETYTVSVAVTLPGSDQLVEFASTSFTTGSIEQITRNVSPTSVSVRFDNRSGAIVDNNNGCLFSVELFDVEDMTAEPIRSEYVLDAQIISPGIPYVESPEYGSKVARNSVPTAVAFGNLKPSTDYWFRVKSVDSYTYSNYQNKGTETTTKSRNGNSEYSDLVKLTTAPSHVNVAGEVLYQGFDDCYLGGDFLNAAVGTYPAYLKAGKKATDLTLKSINEWSGDYCFYPLRPQLGSTQFANIGGKAQILGTNNDTPFVLNAGSTVVQPESYCSGAKIYRLDNTTMLGLGNWIISNRAWPSMGYVVLGSNYKSNGKDEEKYVGCIATPTLDSELLGSQAKTCVLTFKAYGLNGKAARLHVGYHDGTSWSEPITFDLKNASGTTQETSSWSYLDEGHKWYEYSCELQLKNGDMVVFSTDPTTKNAALLDDISIKIK